MTPFNVLTIVQVVLRAIIAVALTRVVIRRPEMRNLRWLVVVFYGNALIGLLPQTSVLYQVLYQVGFLVIQLSLVLFIHETFYRDRSSPYAVFMVAVIAGALANIVTSLTSDPAVLAQPQINPVVPVALNWIWHAVAGYQAYKAIAADRLVEDWVKTRYLMMVAYSAIMAAPMVLLPFLNPLIGASQAQMLFMPVLLSFMIVGIILQFLVWAMPEPYRRWLNRKYQAPAPDQAEMTLSEEEIMRG